MELKPLSSTIADSAEAVVLSWLGHIIPRPYDHIRIVCHPVDMRCVVLTRVASLQSAVGFNAVVR